MGFPATQVLDVIYQLLPGFFAAWIFYGLTAHPKKDSFERSVQALIFTGIVKVIITPIYWLALLIGYGFECVEIHPFEWSKDGEFCLSIVLGALVGLLCTYYANTNKFHIWIADKIDGITSKTSYPSEWYSVFRRHKRYVYLYLTEEFNSLRLFGWAEEWPDSPDGGQFVLMQAAWISEDNTRTNLPMAERIVIQAKYVKLVEFEYPESEWGNIVPLPY